MASGNVMWLYSIAMLTAQKSLTGPYRVSVPLVSALTPAGDIRVFSVETYLPNMRRDMCLAEAIRKLKADKDFPTFVAVAITTFCDSAGSEPLEGIHAIRIQVESPNEPIFAHMQKFQISKDAVEFMGEVTDFDRLPTPLIYVDK